ncbi:MAG: hypothetical protein IH895_09065, partial [Planctomycetes bacterium]|nr:hypothetical protein [Planctomycetota bacterium]
IGFEPPGVNECEPDEKDEQLKLIAAKGMEHEKAFLERLREEGHQIAELDGGSTGLADTIEAMKQQKDFIFQARLEHEIFGGFADFLALKDGKSSLGDHHYEVWDTKLARSPKASFIVQLCAYAEMLEHLQLGAPEPVPQQLGQDPHIQSLGHNPAHVDPIAFIRARP